MIEFLIVLALLSLLIASDPEPGSADSSGESASANPLQKRPWKGRST